MNWCLNGTLRWIGASLLLGLLLGATLALGGCNIVGPAVALAAGPPTQDALFELPPKKTVVFIDDRGNVIPRARLRRIAAARTTQELLQTQRLVPAAVQPEAAMRIASIEEHAAPLPIDEIGRRVGAEMVIYAEVERFSLADGGVPQPVAVYRVKVIDVETGERLWPEDPAGHPVVARMAMKTDFRYQGVALDKLEDGLADLSGLRIAQLFFKHEPTPFDGELSD